MVLMTTLQRLAPWSLWRMTGTPYREMNWSSSKSCRGGIVNGESLYPFGEEVCYYQNVLVPAFTGGKWSHNVPRHFLKRLCRLDSTQWGMWLWLGWIALLALLIFSGPGFNILLVAWPVVPFLHLFEGLVDT